MSVSFPNQMFIKSLYSAEEFSEMLLNPQILLTTSELTEENQKLAVNFDLTFIKENRSVFPGITDEIITQYENGEIIFYPKLEGLDSSIYDFFGLLGGVESETRSIELHTELNVPETVLDDMFNTVSSTQTDYELEYNKVKTTIYNLIDLPDIHKLRITDSLGRAYSRQSGTDTLIIALDKNGVELPFTYSVDEGGDYWMNFKSDIEGTPISINYLKKKT